MEDGSCPLEHVCAQGHGEGGKYPGVQAMPGHAQQPGNLATCESLPAAACTPDNHAV